MATDFQLSYRSLPLRLYEMTRYSFRREQSGELVGLRRLRAFTMPDCHAFCKDMNQAYRIHSVSASLILFPILSFLSSMSTLILVSVSLSAKFSQNGKNSGFIGISLT